MDRLSFDISISCIIIYRAAFSISIPQEGECSEDNSIIYRDSVSVCHDGGLCHAE